MSSSPESSGSAPFPTTSVIVTVVTSIFALAAIIVLFLVIRRMRQSQRGPPIHDAEKFAAWREQQRCPKQDARDPHIPRPVGTEPCPQPGLYQKLRLFILRKPPLRLSNSDLLDDATSLKAFSTNSSRSHYQTSLLIVHHLPSAQEFALTIPRNITVDELKVLVIQASGPDGQPDQPRDLELHRVADRIQGVSEVQTDEQLSSFLDIFKYAPRTHIYIYNSEPKPDNAPAEGTTAEPDGMDVADMSATPTEAGAERKQPAPLTLQRIRLGRLSSDLTGSWVEVNSVVMSVGMKSQQSPVEGKWW